MLSLMPSSQLWTIYSAVRGDTEGKGCNCESIRISFSMTVLFGCTEERIPLQNWFSQPKR